MILGMGPGLGGAPGPGTLLWFGGLIVHVVLRVVWHVPSDLSREESVEPFVTIDEERELYWY